MGSGSGRMGGSGREGFAVLWRIPIRLMSSTYPGGGGLVCGDWDGDGRPEILVRTNDGITVFDARGKKRTRFPVGDETQMLALGRTPSGPLLVGYKLWGHAVEAYDRRGQRLWIFPSDDGIDSVAFANIDHADGDAVLVGYNGGPMRLLDSHGNCLWSIETGANVWSVASARLSRRGPASMVAVVNGLGVFDALGKRTRLLTDCDPGAVSGADIDGDGIDELLGLGTWEVSGGYLWVFGADGRLRWKRKAWGGTLRLQRPIVVGRFRGRGTQSVVGDTFGTLFVFDGDGTPRPKLEMADDLFAIATLRGTGDQDLLLTLTPTALSAYTWRAAPSKP